MSEKTCKERVREHLKGRISDLRKLWRRYQKGIEESDPDLGRFEDYGLCFGYVPKGTFSDQKNGFFHYQLSTGGPGDEFRFFTDKESNLYKVEYWFLDWFDGASIELKGRNLALLTEIFESFDEIGMVSHEYALAMEE